MVHVSKPGDDSIICLNLNKDLVALTILRGASQAAHRFPKNPSLFQKSTFAL
jgi:hypothetical protein